MRFVCPPGWLLLNLGDSGSDPIHDWDTVIQNVSRVHFHHGDPTFFFIFQLWIIGADNVRITATGIPPVPATTTWGLLILTLVLLGLATWFMGRRRRAV